MKESTRMRTQLMRPAYFWLAVLFILISGFAIRVIDLNGASLWADEAYTQLWMNAPAHRFLPLILEDGVHVPLYFMILRLFPHGGEMLLRLPSALEGLIGIALLIGVVRRLYHNDRFALLAGALLAYNPFHIWFSRSARPYALLFVTVELVLFFAADTEPAFAQKLGHFHVKQHGRLYDALFCGGAAAGAVYRLRVCLEAETARFSRVDGRPGDSRHPGFDLDRRPDSARRRAHEYQVDSGSRSG
jgi:predicted membrane-bound mannosyltransferase